MLSVWRVKLWDKLAKLAKPVRLFFVCLFYQLQCFIFSGTLRLSAFCNLCLPNLLCLDPHSCGRAQWCSTVYCRGYTLICWPKRLMSFYWHNSQSTLKGSIQGFWFKSNLKQKLNSCLSTLSIQQQSLFLWSVSLIWLNFWAKTGLAKTFSAVKTGIFFKPLVNVLFSKSKKNVLNICTIKT